MITAGESVFAKYGRSRHLLRLHGFWSATHGPLVIPVVNDAENNVGVYDGGSGVELNWFTGLRHAYPASSVASHVYEADGRMRLAIAPDGDPIRQWEIPSGQPVGAPIPTGGRSRALTSYHRAGREVLVVVDDRGTVRRFDAEHGDPIGEPLFPPTGVLCRVGTRLGRQMRPAVTGMAHNHAWDPWATEPTLLIAAGRHIWRVALDSGGVATMRPRPLARIWGLLPAPQPGGPALVARADGGLIVLDAADEHPIGPTAQLRRGFSEGFAVVPSGPARVFVIDGARVLSWGGDRGPLEVVLDPGEIDDNYWLEDLCALRVGDRTAVFASDGTRIYRYDAAALAPWPAAPN